MFATAAQITEATRLVKSILNAASTGWAGAIDDERRSDEAITASIRYATVEVIKSIAKNPQHGFWGLYASMVEVEHDQFLPMHTGTVGIPQITAFQGAKPQTAIEADPDEIDSYRNDCIKQFAKTKHDCCDDCGMASPLAHYYSIVNNRLKFTGKRCEVPMVRLRDSNYDDRIPYELLPTIVKLAVHFNLKEGDSLQPLADLFYQKGIADLAAIEQGVTSTQGVADIAAIQKEI